jgi:hypothetical protein
LSKILSVPYQKKKQLSNGFDEIGFSIMRVGRSEIFEMVIISSLIFITRVNSIQLPQQRGKN